MSTKKKLNPQYQKQIEQVKIDGEDYCNEEMQPVYKEQKKSLDTLNVLLGALFVKFGIDGLLRMNSTQKASIGVDNTLKDMGKNLSDVEVSKVTDILSKSYSDTYYKNLYTMDSGLKVDLKFNILKPEYINAAVNQEFKGEMFSDRIWKNKADMIDKLSSSLIEAMKGNTHLDAIAKDIQKTFNVTAYESQRLVNTENARVQSQASMDIGHNTGVKQVIYTATLDGKTSPECAETDGSIWDIDSPDVIQPPSLHPNCRCVLQNIVDGWTPSSRKDNETGEIIPYVSYNEWKANKGIDDNEE